MEKVRNNIQVNLQVLDTLELGYDEIAKKKVKEQLGLSRFENGIESEEDEVLMFLLCRSVLY